MDALVQEQLPYVDEHETAIDAAAADVWRALVATMSTAFSGAPAAAYARAVGCHDTGDSGPRPLTEGSTIPGFHVATAVAERELTLAGRHRFSTYALTFRLDASDAATTRLRAETRAAFPGIGGRVYGALVIGSGGHAVAVRRMLAAVKRRSEQRKE